MTHQIYKQEDIDRVREALAMFDSEGYEIALTILKDQGKAVSVVGHRVCHEEDVFLTNETNYALSFPEAERDEVYAITTEESSHG